MARKSRKQSIISAESKPLMSNKYIAALYARISVETDESREKDSIGNQIQLLRNYVCDHSDLEVYDTYVDDSISGATFHRPEFTRMIADAKNGKINCIIVKDLSRLGRNYLETGEYIEKIFPFLQCRFISITDGFDSKYKNVDLSIQLKNAANDVYAKDISRKVCHTKHQQQINGKYMGSHPPYGYQFDSSELTTLVPDPETAIFVSEIFESCSNGKSNCEIARSLNRRSIPSPGQVLYSRGQYQRESCKNARWTACSVHRILKNPIYIGWTVSGKSRSNYQVTGSKRGEAVAEKEWIVVHNTHEPLISKEIFESVQTKLDYNKEHQIRAQESYVAYPDINYYKGLLFCGECGHPMQLSRKTISHKKLKKWYYICRQYTHHGKSACPKKAIQKDYLDEMVLKLIQLQMTLFIDAQGIVKSLNKSEFCKSRHKELSTKISIIKKQISKDKSLKASLYEDLADGLISTDDYILLRNKYEANLSKLKGLLPELENELQEYSEDYSVGGYWCTLVNQYQHSVSLNHNIVAAFIEKIIVYNDKPLEVHFKCAEELEEVIHLASARKLEVSNHASS